MFGRFSRPIMLLSLIVFFPPISVLPADAHYLVRGVNLEEMTVLADRIFVGRCAAVEQAEAWIAGGRFPVTRYTFEVERAVKGRLPPTITFRQLSHGLRSASGESGDIATHGRAVIRTSALQGMPGYRVGERLLLFLNAEAPRSRMTSPVGLYQGAFFIYRGPDGEEFARNSVKNRGLFSTPYAGVGLNAYEARVVSPKGFERSAAGVRALARDRAALPLDQFIGVVEQIVTAHGDAKDIITGSEEGRLPR